MGFFDCLKAAFNARPAGMFVPPNWIGLGAFALLGYMNPGFWLLGAGLELGYLYALATNARFQRVIRGKALSAEQRRSQDKLDVIVRGLSDEDRRRYHALEARCQSILEQQQTLESAPDIQNQQREGLGRLLWIYMRLLVTRDSIRRILPASSGARSEPEPLDRRIQRIEEQVKEASITEDLRKSLTGQLEILQQRLQSRHEAEAKLEVVNAELGRIEQQVELLRDQALLATDPAVVSQRIDQIGATLGGTTQWVKEQQQIYGKVGDLLEEPPQIPLRNPVKEAQ